MSQLPQVFGFASNEWHTPWWMARQHLFTRLATRGWPVVYSTGPQSLWERHTEKWRHGSLLHGFDRVEAKGRAQVLVDRPGKCMPLRNPDGIWYNLVVRGHARHLMKGAAPNGIRKRLAYFWHPRFWPYFDLLHADYLVFHIHDAWDPNTWPRAYREYLNRIVQRADLIITTAENMARDLPGIGPDRARVLPHGVDFDAVEAGASVACPTDLAAIPRPRIGYTGRVNLKLDLPLIIQAATMRPDWHWVFVGATGIGTTYSFEGRPSVNTDWQQLNQMPNVHFLGVKERHEIPAYLNNFDVLSLPFSSSYVGFPTKLLEYFASGKPVVSWDGENVRGMANVIEIATGADGWVSGVDRSLRGSQDATRRRRQEIARAGDWNSRTDTLEGWLLELLR